MLILPWGDVIMSAPHANADGNMLALDANTAFPCRTIHHALPAKTAVSRSTTESACHMSNLLSECGWLGLTSGQERLP